MKPRRLAGTFVLAFALPALAFAQPPATGSISGHVFSVDTKGWLEGATVKIVELNYESLVARDGAFAVSGIPAGTYTIEAAYEGAMTKRATARVGPGRPALVDLVLASEILRLDNFVVSSRLIGQAAAVNNQRNAPSLRTIVSADALGQIREGNIGDALVRLPGISVETRAGVQRTATIRGLAPQYNTVNVDSLRMTNVDGDRNIALDEFPANMLARVDVVKALTPDLPADAIGGTVNLLTRSAFDREDRALALEAGTTYNRRLGNWNSQYGITFGDHFGAQQQFGLLVTANYFHDVRGYDGLDQQFAVGAADQTGVTRAFYYDRTEEKVRAGGGVAFDYRPANTTQFFAKALYSYDYRWLDQHGTDYRPADNRVDLVTNYREPKNVFQMFIVGAEHALGSVKLDCRASFSRSKKDYPKTLVVTESFNNTLLSADRANPDFPTFAVTNGMNLHDAAGAVFRQYELSQVPRVENEWNYDINGAKDFAFGRLPLALAGGLRFSRRNSAQAQPATVRYSGLSGASPELLAAYTRGNFMPQAGGRAVLLPFYPDWRRFDALAHAMPLPFTRNVAALNFTTLTRASADWSITENINSAYVMATADLGRLRLMAGLRGEKTSNTSRSNDVAVNSTGAVTNITRASAARSYLNTMPGVHARWLAWRDRLVLRAAYTEGVARPAPADLISSVQENVQLNQRNIGNPSLLPAESKNLDASIEYYFSRLGLLSAGVFYKDIRRFVFTSTRLAADGVRENLKVNGDGGQLTGLELVWQQNLTFLPAPFNGFGFEANGTWLDSNGRYPGRNADPLAFVLAPRTIFNGILVYARRPFDIRLSCNRVAQRLESVGTSKLTDIYDAKSPTWDLAVKYRLFGRAHLFCNVKNLLNEPTVIFQGLRANPTSVVYYGTQCNLGVILDL